MTDIHTSTSADLGDRGAATEPAAASRSGAARIVVVTLMGVLLAAIGGGVFARTLPELTIAPLTVGAAALVTRRLSRSWRAATLVVAVAAGTVAVAFASGGTIGDAALAVVRGPRRLLSTEWPSPIEPSVVTAIGLLVAVATAIAAVLADLPRWRFVPVVPLAVAATMLIALGAPESPPWWSMLALGLGAFTLGAVPAADTVSDRWTTMLGDRTVGVTLGVAAVVALLASAVIAFQHRADPRQIEAADTTSPILDPIESTVALRRAEPAFELFQITDRSILAGRALPTRWRLAALDVYDGARWVPRATLRPIGERLGTTPTINPGMAPPITYDVLYLSGDVDLLPFPGRPISVDTAVQTDIDRVAVRLVERPEPGRTVRVTSMVAPSLAVVSALDGARFVRRQVDEIAQTFVDQARELAGDGDLLEQLRNIESTMRNDWILDRDAAGGGQQLALIERFVSETRRGTREQFVTSFVLFARALGVDARVATGFVIPAGSVTSPLVVDSTTAAAWPEVRISDALDGTDDGAGGWLAFDPVPPRQEPSIEEEAPPPNVQSPAAAQPPIEPPSNQTESDDDPETAATDERGRLATIVFWAVRIGAVTTLGLLPLLIVMGAILALKWRRHRRRLRHPDPALRVRGAWANVADALVDAGLTIGPAWTDDRIARGAAPLAPAAAHELRRLAAMATAMTFGDQRDAWRLVDDATATSNSVVAAVRDERTRWQRIRWRLSLRSLRPRSRSPVVA